MISCRTRWLHYIFTTRTYKEHLKNTSAEGAQALAEALKVNTALERLYLYNKNTSAEGAQALAEALKVNTALERLDLHQNTERFRRGNCPPEIDNCKRISGIFRLSKFESKSGKSLQN